jgi:hypothetical protein
MSIVVEREQFEKLMGSKFQSFARLANTNPIVFGFHFAVCNHVDFNFFKCGQRHFGELMNTLSDLSGESMNKIDHMARKHCHQIRDEKIAEFKLEKLKTLAPLKALYSMGLEGKQARLIGFFAANKYCFQVCLIDYHHKLYDVRQRKVFA